MTQQKGYTGNNVYRVYWNGHRQPLGSNTYESAKAYIKHCLKHGNCYLWQFEIFDNWGQLRTNIINDDFADPTLSKNYFKIYE